MKRLLAMTTIGLAIVLVAGSGLVAPGAAPAAEQSLGPTAEPPQLPALPAEVRARGRWKIAVKCDTSPFGYLNARGENAGYDVDIVRRFAELAFGDRSRVDLTCVTTPSREPTLQSRTVDFVLATFTWTKDRATRLDFSLPYYGAGGRIAVLKSSAITSIADLAGKPVATTTGSLYDRWAPGCQPAMQLVREPSFTGMVAALKEGRAQAIMWDEVFMLGLVATDQQIRLTQDSFLTAPFGIAVRKGEAAMLNWVNAAIRHLTRRDEFFTLLRRNIPPIAVGDVPRPGRPPLAYPGDADPIANCTIVRLPPLETAAAKPRTIDRGVAKASARGLPSCPVCGFEATFRFTKLPPRGSTVTVVWYYNKKRQRQLPKTRTRTVTSSLWWEGPAPRGFYWCDLVVKPPGKSAATVARAVIRRR